MHLGQEFGLDDVVVEVDHRQIALDEDAFARAVVGGNDHRPLEPAWHGHDAGHATGLAGHAAALAHVRDAILQQDEDLGTVIGAQAVARAQILIDPHPHGVPRRMASPRR